MNRVTHPLKQPLLWCAVMLIEWLSFFTSLIILTIHLIMVPTLMLYMKLDIRRFCLAYVSSLFVLFVITGGRGMGVMLLSLFFVPTVGVMGYLYKRKMNARQVIAAATLTLISEILLLLLLSFWSGMHPIDSFKTALSTNYAALPQSLQKMDSSTFKLYIDVFTQMIPFLILITAAFYVALTHGIVRKFLKKSAAPLPGLPPMRLWKLPKTMIWYFLAILGISVILNTGDNLYFQMVDLNLIPLFILLFSIQAVGLLYDIAHFKHWKRRLAAVIVIVTVVLMAVLPFILYLIVLIGFMDVALPLRQRFFKR